MEISIEVWGPGAWTPKLSPPIVENVQRLCRELSKRNPDLVVTKKSLAHCLENNYLVIASDKDAKHEIVGMACLVVMHLPYSIRGYVDNVVVKSSYQGQGIGRLIMTRLHTFAHDLDMRQITLTSSRPGAQAMYRKLGYKQGETTTFRKYFTRD